MSLLFVGFEVGGENFWVVIVCGLIVDLGLNCWMKWLHV